MAAIAIDECAVTSQGHTSRRHAEAPLTDSAGHASEPCFVHTELRLDVDQQLDLYLCSPRQCRQSFPARPTPAQPLLEGRAKSQEPSQIPQEQAYPVAPSASM